MRITLRHPETGRLFTAEVNPTTPPRLIRPVDADVDGLLMDWDAAFDDQHHLRKCPACGCPRLFARREIPLLTGFVALLVVVLALAVLHGLADAPLGVAALALAGVAVANALIFLFGARRLVCYRCRTEFRDVPPSRDQGEWDAAVDRAYRAPPAERPVRSERRPPAAATRPARTSPAKVPTDRA